MSAIQPRHPVRRLAVGASCGALIVSAITGIESSSTAQVGAAPIPATITVLGNGNGHGHGLSQYGARGAATAGLTAKQIVAFYYPNTTLVTLPATYIRVRLSGAGSLTTVRPVAGLTVTGVAGTLAVTGVSRYRLIPSGAGLAAQKLTGSAWSNIKTGLPAAADFGNAARGMVQVYLADGTSADYRGTVGARRSGTGEITVNRLPLNSYVPGVVPRESPSSWPAAALQAQSIAARTYSRYAVEHNASAASDICDTDSCQVYGGYARYDASGARVYGEQATTNAAAVATADQVLQYAGQTIFAQFSASSGGWTVDGGQPYLVAKADPYDNASTGDPYLHWTRTVVMSSVAAHYGLRTITRIDMVRDGHGEWGGRVLSATVVGVDSAGTSRSVATSGFALQAAMGLPHNWFYFATPPVDHSGGSVVAPTASSVEFFGTTSTSGLRAQTYVTGSGWQAPVNLAAPTAGLIWDPDAATWGNGHVDVAAADATRHLVIRTFVPGRGWSAWHTMPAVLGSSPAAVSSTPNAVNVFYLGPARTLETIRWTAAGGWVGPAAVPGVHNAVSGADATAAVQTTKDVSVVYRGVDNRFWTVTFHTAGGWGPPAPVNPTHPLPSPSAALDPSIGGTGSGGVSVYYTAGSGVIYHSAYDVTTKAWSAWFPVPGSTSATSAPDVAAKGASHVDVIAGANGQARRTAWNAPATWSSWSDLS
jgi:SpoIID/LytB domain protein